MSEIKVGTPDVQPDKPSHTPGVPEGNAPGEQPRGYRRDGTATATRSTGIRAKDHEPILPTMPVLTPA